MIHEDIENIAKRMVEVWERLPKFYRKEPTIKRTLQCFLFSYFEEKGLMAVADYFPPRITERPVDIIVIDQEDPKKITLAICIDELITLSAVKSLSSFEVGRKIIFTTHPLDKKVKESKFFLKDDIEHYHLKGPHGERLL